ncbi:MAG: hypothetical protein IPI14_11355 [Polaromonas sp.]|nr:hypothetical protein [Polaromonas sp.]
MGSTHKKTRFTIANYFAGKMMRKESHSYAEGIARTIEGQYPTNVFARDLLANSQIAKGEVKRIFEKYEEFDLDKESLVEHIIKMKE